MGLDQIVRNITAPETSVESDKKDVEKNADIPQKVARSRRGNMKVFEENLAKYTGINEQGIAIWLPNWHSAGSRGYPKSQYHLVASASAPETPV